jgi:hypothetical protein
MSLKECVFKIIEMFLRFIFFLSFASAFAQTPTILCEEKWDNGTSKCGPVYYSGADLLSDNMYICRKFDIGRLDSLVYDLGNTNYQELDSLVLEMDFYTTSTAIPPIYDTLSNGFENKWGIDSFYSYIDFSAKIRVLCKWKVEFEGEMRMLKSGRLGLRLPASKLKKTNTIMRYSLIREYGFLEIFNAITFRTKYINCPSGQTERQLYNCMCDNTSDPSKCKLFYNAPTAPFSFNLTIDNFVAVGYKSGVITSIEQQNDGLTNTKQVIARYDMMGRSVETNSPYSGVLILVFSDGSRQKVFVQ